MPYTDVFDPDKEKEEFPINASTAPAPTNTPTTQPRQYTTVPTAEPVDTYTDKPVDISKPQYTTVPTIPIEQYVDNPVDIRNPPPPQTGPIGIGGSFNPPPPTYAAPPTLPTYTAPSAVNPINAVTSANSNPIVAAKSGNVTIGGANSVGATPVEDARLANASLAANTEINTTDQNQVRQQQMDFLKMLHDAAYGEGGPSAAENMYKRASDDALRSQFALAASVHGYGAGAANRQAGFNAANIQQKAALDTGIIRAQEQQAARALLGQSLTSTRDADQKLSFAQANLDQATKALNANLQTTVNVNNAEAMNERNRLQAQLDQATAFRNAAADESMRAHQAEMDLQNSQFNVGQENATNQFNTSTQQQNNQFNTQQQNTTNQFNNTQEQQRNTLDAQLRQQFGITLTQLEQQNNQFNAGQGQQNTQYFSGLQNQRDIANLQAMLQAMGYNNDQIRTFIQGYAGSAGAVSGQDAANRQEQDKFFWDMVNLGGNYVMPGSGTLASGAGGGMSRGAVGPTDADNTLPVKF
jgi:hypothetical protein